MNNKKVLIIKILLVLLIVLVVALVGSFIYSKLKKEEIVKPATFAELNTLSRLDKKAEDKSSTLDFTCDAEVDASDLSKNIKILGEATEDKGTNTGHLTLFVKNNNATFVDINSTILFYDENNSEISKEVDYSYSVQPCGYTLIKFSIPESYESYKVNFDTTDYYHYMSDEGKKKEKIEERKKEIQKLSITVNDDDKNIYGNVKNEGSEALTYDVCVVYFYSDEYVRGECITQLSQAAGSTVQSKFKNYYFDKKYKGFNFDSYKVFIA